MITYTNLQRKVRLSKPVSLWFSSRKKKIQSHFEVQFDIRIKNADETMIFTVRESVKSFVQPFIRSGTVVPGNNSVKPFHTEVLLDQRRDGRTNAVYP
jgi:hypothetical protein